MPWLAAWGCGSDKQLWGMCRGGSVSVFIQWHVIMHPNGSRLVDTSQFLLTMARHGLLYANITAPSQEPILGQPALSSISLFSIPPRSSTSYCNNRRPGELDQSQHYAKNKAKYSGPVISIWLIQLDIIILCPEPHYPVPGSLRINIPPEPQWPI